MPPIRPWPRRATAEGWAAYRGMAARHFDYLKASLDTEDASWRE
jgi:hypothetical protein